MNLLGKIATTIIGTKVASETGKAGLAGVAAGMIATRVMTRSPAGAILVGAAFLGHKLWQKKKQIDTLGPHGAAVADGLAEPDQPALPPTGPGAVESRAEAQGVAIAPPTP